MYRGWYKGGREYGSAVVPWELCVAEWNSQFYGDAAFRISEEEKDACAGRAPSSAPATLWHRWDYPHELGSLAARTVPGHGDVRHGQLARVSHLGGIGDQLLGVRGYWKLRDGVDRRRKELKVDWDRLQRPGFSPDYIDGRFEAMETAFERSDWAPTPAGQALMRNNMPLLAYIGGKPEAFTSKDHNFFPGETVDEAADHHQRLARSGDVRCRVVAGLAGRCRPARKRARWRSATRNAFR